LIQFVTIFYVLLKTSGKRNCIEPKILQWRAYVETNRLEVCRISRWWSEKRINVGGIYIYIYI